MADNNINYFIRIDNKFVEEDMKSAETKVSSAASKIAGAVKRVGLSVGSALLDVGKSAITFGTQFETSMAKSSGLIDTTSVDMDMLGDKILDLSNKTGIAAADLGTTMYNALSDGVQLGEGGADMMAFLEESAKLAKAGFTDIDTAVAATAKVMNDYKLSVEDTDNIQKILMQTQNLGAATIDELASSLANVTPTAAEMGVGFDQVGAALATMTAQETPAAEATEQLNSLFKELGKEGSNAQKALEAAAEGTQYAGMSFQDMMAAGVPLNEVLDMMGVKADASDQALIDMFGSLEAGTAALSLSGENAGQYTDNLASMSTEIDVVSEAANKMDSTTVERFDMMLNNLKNTSIELYNQMLPFIEEIMPQLQELLPELIEPVLDLAGDILPKFGEILTEIMPMLSELMKDILPIIVELFDLLVTPLLEIVSEILPVLMELLDALLPILETLMLLLEPITDLFKALLEPILNLITNAITPLISILKYVIDLAIIPLIIQLGYMQGIFTAVFNFISDLVTNAVQSWMDVFKNIIDFVKNVFTGDWEAAWENVKNVFKAIATGIGNVFKAPINFIIDLVNGFIEGINNIKIPDWVPLIGGTSFNISLIPRLKAGMDFVPKDFFPAFLDYGERVLTREENAAFNAMGGLYGMQTASTDAAAQPLTVYNKMEGVVEIDGFTIGKIVLKNIDDVKDYS